MRELREWLKRLDGIVPPPPKLKNLNFRVATPTPLHFDDSVVRVQDTGTELPVVGGLPVQVSVLSGLDLATQTNAASDMAVATQLGAVLTMATNRRIRVASNEVLMQVQGSTQHMIIPAQVSDRELDGPVPDDVKQRFEELLSRIAGLEERDAVSIGNALNLHYAAVLLCDVDISAAYALLVAGVEVLSQAYGEPLSEWSKWDQAQRFEKAFEQAALSAEQCEAMRTTVLRERYIGLRQRSITLQTYTHPSEADQADAAARIAAVMEGLG